MKNDFALAEKYFSAAAAINPEDPGYARNLSLMQKLNASSKQKIKNLKSGAQN